MVSHVVSQERVGEVEHALYGAQRAKEEAAKRAALEERAAKKAAEKAKIQKAREWSDEEVRLLEKGLDKFPQVTSALCSSLVCIVPTCDMSTHKHCAA